MELINGLLVEVINIIHEAQPFLIMSMAGIGWYILIIGEKWISADNVQITASGDVTNTGMIKAVESVNIQAVNIAYYGGTIDGGKSTQLTAGQNIVNFSGTINGDLMQLIAGNDIKNETISVTNTQEFITKTVAGNDAGINAGENLVLQAGLISLLLALRLLQGKTLR